MVVLNNGYGRTKSIILFSEFSKQKLIRISPRQMRAVYISSN
jgi:hypothetical protein